MEKLSPREEICKGPPCAWSERIWHQYAEKHAYGHGSFGADFHACVTGEAGGGGDIYGGLKRAHFLNASLESTGTRRTVSKRYCGIL
jgi:hypothetical protein